MWTVVGVTAIVITTIAVVAAIAAVDPFDINNNNKPLAADMINRYGLMTA